jgi:hypothetical protein
MNDQGALAALGGAASAGALISRVAIVGRSAAALALPSAQLA